MSFLSPNEPVKTVKETESSVSDVLSNFVLLGRVVDGGLTVAYCYTWSRPSLSVCLSVCRSHYHDREPCKNG